MIPAIGFIIGAYTIVRFISFMSSKNESGLVKVCSAIALVFTLLALFDLFVSGSKIPLPR